MPQAIFQNRLHNGNPMGGGSIPVTNGALALAGQFVRTGWIGPGVGRAWLTGRVPSVVPMTFQFGPTPDVTPPGGAVAIAAGSTSASRQTLINANPTGTNFALAAGTHTATSSNVPKTGQQFWGHYGAIIDGSTWTGASENDGAFLGNNNGVTDVCIRNLVIRNMPKKGIHNRENAIRWTVEYCEIHNTQWGLIGTSGIAIRHCYLHDNGGVTAGTASGGVARGPGSGNYDIFETVLYDPSVTSYVEYNRISFGGDQQKAINTAKIEWRGNWVHDNEASGIWNDSQGINSIIENNIVEDNLIGIHWEMSIAGIIRNNVIRRSGDQAIYCSTSRDNEIYGNVMTDNFRGIVLGLTCEAIDQQWSWLPDLRNNDVHDNTTIITAAAPAGSIASLFHRTSGCQTPTAFHDFVADYLSNNKNNWFTGNTYLVNTGTNRLYMWKAANTTSDAKTWAEWQALGQDAGGSFTIG